MIVTVSTELDADVDVVWRLVKRTSTFLHVTRGLLGVARARDLPEEWQAGEAVRCRLLLFHFLPGWLHHLRLVRVNEAQRELRTEEHGGLLRAWNHTIRVEAVSPGRCRYTDTVEVRAGPATAVVWAVAHGFFRYRQRRLRRYVRAFTS